MSIRIEAPTETHTNIGTIVGSGANTQIAYYSGATTLTGSNVLIWSNSNLGIGTAPVYKLDVNGIGRFTSTASGQSLIALGLVVNDDGNASGDFRAETDTEPNHFVVDASANLTRIGDFDTNYTEFASDGLITRHGTARTTNALWVPAGGIRAPGLKPATYISHGIDGAWSFADQALAANQETVSGAMRVPHRMDRTVAPEVKIVWSADGASPGVCEWQLEYLYCLPNESTTVAAQETLTTTSTASTTANGLVTATITGVDLASDTDVGFLWRIKRLSADGSNDTIADTVELLGVIFNFTSDKLGTPL